MTDKPMDVAAVLAAAERIAMEGAAPAISATARPMPTFGQRIYSHGQWWVARWSEPRPGVFECSWEPGLSSPA